MGQTRPHRPRVRVTDAHPITDTNAIRLRDRNGPIPAARTRSKSSELSTVKWFADLLVRA